MSCLVMTVCATLSCHNTTNHGLSESFVDMMRVLCWHDSWHTMCVSRVMSTKDSLSMRVLCWHDASPLLTWLLTHNVCQESCQQRTRCHVNKGLALTASPLLTWLLTHSSWVKRHVNKGLAVNASPLLTWLLTHNVTTLPWHTMSLHWLIS